MQRGASSIGSSARSDVSSSQLQAARFARGEARYASGKGAAKPDAGHAVSNIGGLLFPAAASRALRQLVSSYASISGVGISRTPAGKAVLTCLGFWTLLRVWPVSILPWRPLPSSQTPNGCVILASSFAWTAAAVLCIPAMTMWACGTWATRAI